MTAFITSISQWIEAQNNTSYNYNNNNGYDAVVEGGDGASNGGSSTGDGGNLSAATDVAMLESPQPVA